MEKTGGNPLIFSTDDFCNGTGLTISGKKWIEKNPF